MCNDKRPVKNYLPKVRRPIVKEIAIIFPTWGDGSFPGWQMEFIVEKNSPKTPGEILNEAQRLLPEGQVDTFTLMAGNKVSMKIAGIKGSPQPRGLNEFLNLLCVPQNLLSA